MNKLTTWIIAILGVIGTVFLFVLNYQQAGYIALMFTVIMFLTLVVLYFMDYQKYKKQDKTYYALNEEHTLNAFNKLKIEKDQGALKALSVVYINVLGEQDDVFYKWFGKRLTKGFNIDPVGYIDGYIIIFANVHELMLKEMMRQFIHKLKEEADIQIDYGSTYYTGKETLYDLINEAKALIK